MSVNQNQFLAAFDMPMIIFITLILFEQENESQNEGSIVACIGYVGAAGMTVVGTLDVYLPVVQKQ